MTPDGRKTASSNPNSDATVDSKCLKNDSSDDLWKSPYTSHSFRFTRPVLVVSSLQIFPNATSRSDGFNSGCGACSRMGDDDEEEEDIDDNGDDDDAANPITASFPNDLPRYIVSDGLAGALMGL